MHTTTRTVLVVFALVLAFYGAPRAQTTTTGTLSGTIVDQQGGLLPGVTVTAVHTPTGTTYEGVAQADGHYTFVGVRVGGPYTVTATLQGFKDQVKSGINVNLGEEKAVDFKLELATVTETVTVTAETPLVDSTRAGTAANVSTETIENLPTLARSLTDYARLSPHFAVNPVGSDAQSLTVAGRNDRYNNIQIDGAVNNDVFGLASSGTPGGQTSVEPISLDAIQELQLVVSAYDVRQGGFSGGSVNAITKNGTNRVRGTGYYYGRSQGLVGNGPNDREFGSFDVKQFGASVGGPLARNRAFYFGNVEIGRRETPAGTSISGSGATFGHEAEVERFLSILKNRYGYDPGGNEEFTRATDNNKAFVRGDFNLGTRHQLTVRHNYVDGFNDIGTPTVNSYLFPDGFYRIEDTTNSAVMQLNSTLGRSFNELRFTLQTIRDKRGGQPGKPVFPRIRVTTADNRTLNAGIEQFSTANALDQDVYELTDDFTLVRGKHTVTIGTHNEFLKFRNLFIRDNFGTWSFNSLDLFEQGLAQSYDYSFGTVDPQFAARFRVRQFGFYAGDQWRVRDDLTLTYGLRFDAPTFPDKPTANPIALNTFGFSTDVVPDSRVLSPRFGFNYSVSAARREQIRGGVGVFSGRTPYVWLSNQYGNTGIEITRLNVPFSTARRLPFVADPKNQPQSAQQLGVTPATNEIDLMDPDYEYPQTLRGNIAYDRELGVWGLVATAEVLFSKTLKEIAYQNLNTVAAGITRPDGRPVFRRGIASLSDVIFLTNTDEGRQWSTAFKLERPWRNRFFGSASYVHNRSYSINDGRSSQAASNWGFLYVPGDPNNPPLAVSDFDVRHRINIGGSYDVRFGRMSATVSMFYNGQSGRPYALAFFQDVNGDTRTSNDLLYIPNSASEVVTRFGTGDQLMAWLQDDPCAMDFAGRIQPRNTCRMPWTNQMDVRLAVGVPFAGTREVEFTMDFFNFLNIFNNEWGRVRFASNNANTDVRYDGIDAATGKMIYNISRFTASSYQGRFLTDDVRSRWQAQFGLRLKF
jgi:hypothetical protein